MNDTGGTWFNSSSYSLVEVIPCTCGRLSIVYAFSLNDRPNGVSSGKTV